jgi:hypothetical protein
MPKNNFKNQSGVVIVFSIILISVLLSAALSVALIFTPKLRASAEIRHSAGAIYAADTGIEWCLYVNRKGAIAAPVLSNGATVTLLPANCLTFPIKSTGNYRGTTRVLEANL